MNKASKRVTFQIQALNHLLILCIYGLSHYDIRKNLFTLFLMQVHGLLWIIVLNNHNAFSLSTDVT